MTERPAYTWQPPKFWVGQRVSFLNHRDATRIGTIRYLVTSYLCGAAQHQYGIQPDGRRRWEYHSEVDMLGEAL